MEDVLLEVFDFIPRKLLGNSTSLVNRRFNTLAQSKMHIRGKHFVKKELVLMGRQKITMYPWELDDWRWRECCLAIDGWLSDELFFLPISPTIPENISGLRKVDVDHFSGPQLAPFLNETIGHFLAGCSLCIKFSEDFSYGVREAEERAEFDQFIRQFYVRCKAISIFSQDRHQFQQMPAFLLQPQIMAKLWLIQIKDSIPREHLDLFVDWLHTPFLNGQVVEEKKLQFETADRELLDQLVGIIRQRFSSPGQCQPVPFRLEIKSMETEPKASQMTYMGGSPFTRREASRPSFVPLASFLERNESTGEILSLENNSFLGGGGRLYELRRRHMQDLAYVEYGLKGENSGCKLSIKIHSPSEVPLFTHSILIHAFKITCKFWMKNDLQKC